MKEETLETVGIVQGVTYGGSTDGSGADLVLSIERDIEKGAKVFVC